ncbi:hypothetical protein [Methanosarcina siciliae]|nr:hypothetical protein [Methanosarcina siciliae]
MHIMINSLTEFGYAKWILHPLSLAGLYPYSYSSSVLFFLSGIQQVAGLEMNTVIFIYTIFLAVFSVFATYLMAGTLIDDDFFKHIVTIIFSTIPAMVTYTTYTIGTRPLLIVLVPFLMYLLLNKGNHIKQIILIFLLIPFLFITHHLFYFLLPMLVIYILSKICSKLAIYEYLVQNASKKYSYLIPILIPIVLFMVFYSIPVIFKKFLEEGSRYQFPIISYIRYVGPSIIYSIGGLVYLTLKQNKVFNEWILLLSTLSLASFIYVPTYMKWFIPLFLVPLAGIGIINILKAQNKKYTVILLTIILIVPIIYTGYFQYISKYEENEYYGRYIDGTTYNTGVWMKEFTSGNAISNNEVFSYRIFAISDTTHFLIPYTTIDAIYDFVDTNVSSFKRYPLSSDKFWFDGYEGPDFGENLWYSLHELERSPEELEIEYIVEYVKANGNVVWNHASFPSKIIERGHSESLIYDVGTIKIWNISY